MYALTFLRISNPTVGLARDFFLATEFRNTESVALPRCNRYPGGYILPELQVSY